MSETAVATLNNSTEINLAAGYSSITETDMDTKKKVFTAVTAAIPLRDNLGKVLNVVDVLSQPIVDVNEETGEAEEYTRVTLITDDGKAYSASSTGVVNVLNTAFKVFGAPSTWPEGGIAFKAKEVKSNNNAAWRYVTLEIV